MPLIATPARATRAIRSFQSRPAPREARRALAPIALAIALLAPAAAWGFAYYVTPTGTSLAIGTMDHPTNLQTGFLLMHPGDSLKIATGAYSWTEAVDGPLPVSVGEWIEGGLDPTTWAKDWQHATVITIHPTLLQPYVSGRYVGAFVGVNLYAVSQFTLKDLTLNVMPENASGTTDGYGRSVYGVRLEACSNYLLSRVRILTGNASSGAAGTNGTLDDVYGGGDGLTGTKGNDNYEICGVGGEGGDTHWDLGPAGMSTCGTNGHSASNGTTWRGGGPGGGGGGGGGHGEGKGGAGGYGGNAYWGSGSGQAGGGRPGTSDCHGDNGNTGTSGSTGSQGTSYAGSYPGIVAAQRDIFFVPYRGRDGGDGGGGGGGGGGSGGSAAIGGVFCNKASGSGGWGGGAGGDGGHGGTGGHGGGSTYAVYLVNNGANGRIEGCTLTPGWYGAGGQGGTPSAGATGGSGGGYNWVVPINGAGYGAPAGNGGTGGPGGYGEYGAWGEKLTVYRASGVAPLVTAGANEPTITSVKDVSNDQGGFVRVAWLPCGTDLVPTRGIGSYRLWRLAATAPEPTQGSPEGGELVATGTWELMAQVPATQAASYSAVSATLADSTPGVRPYLQFVVDAIDATSSDVYVSPPDSGYSVDNLAPLRPTIIGVDYGAGGATLHWGSRDEPDLFGFRLYRGTTVNFTPTVANRIAAPRDTGYFDPTGDTWYLYQVSSVDVHGNEGPYSCFTPGMPTPTQIAVVRASAGDGCVRVEWFGGTPGQSAALYRSVALAGWESAATLTGDGAGHFRFTDSAVTPGLRYGYRLGVTRDGRETVYGETWVDVPVQAEFALGGARPNPSPGPLSVTFVLPEARPAALSLFDLASRCVLTRDVGALGAGRHTLALAPETPLSPGVYMVRLTQGARCAATRVVILR